MVKKIIAVASSFLMLLCIVPFAAFADVLDTCPKCGERTYVQETGLTVDACGIGVTYNTKHCTSCRYSYYEWSLFGRTGYKEFESGTGDNLVADFISEWIWANFGKNANFKKYETGGGSAGTGGVGRNPSGYVNSNKGIPSVSSDGSYTLEAKYYVSNTRNITFTGTFVPPEWSKNGDDYDFTATADGITLKTVQVITIYRFPFMAPIGLTFPL